MLIRKDQQPILITISILILAFGSYFIFTKNYEFIIYVLVIIAVLLLILFTNNRVNYSNFSLWGLAFWGLLHMSGGSIRIGEGRLYEVILIPISESYKIFKYDQFVHIIGFGVATIIMYEVLKPILKENLDKWSALSIVVVMAGLGVGAVNEMIEFLATVISPSTGVGGYINTSLDLVADLIGAGIAMWMIRIREEKK